MVRNKKIPKLIKYYLIFDVLSIPLEVFSVILKSKIEAKTILILVSFIISLIPLTGSIQFFHSARI